MVDEEDPEKQKKLEIEMQRRDAKRSQRKTAKMKVQPGFTIDWLYFVVELRVLNVVWNAMVNPLVKSTWKFELKLLYRAHKHHYTHG